MKLTFIKEIFLFCLIILLHLPFINADPDYNISWSRGPFTDEGLYSSQIRNYINHKHFNLHESDALVKTPLLSVILFIPYWALGTHLWVGRLVIILISTIILLYCHRKFKIPYLIPVFFLCSMMQYYIFHHTHFVMAEMLSSSFLLASIFFYYSFMQEDSSGKKWQGLFLSITFLSLAWMAKIQFIYLAALIPGVYTIHLIFNRKKSGKQELLFLSFTLFISLLYIGIYYLAWILPNKQFIDYLMPLQGGQFKIDANTPELIKLNLTTIFLGKELLIFTIAFILSACAGTFILIKSPGRWFAALFSSSMIWVLLESHKLTMSYLPSRYLVSAYFAMGLVISVVLVYLLYSLKGAKLIIPYCVISALVLFHSFDYYRALTNRHYVLKDINTYLSHYDFGERLVIGTWAASCNWESGAITIPVWQDLLNYKDPINTYNPAMVISEADEGESDGTYKKQNIDLASISDSVKQYQLRAWQINLYWIKKNK
jgi:hypothetical protein